MFALLLAITLSVPSFAFAADEASESNAYSAAPARAERLIAKGKVIDPNGQPVAGVAVIIDETKTGTVTDGNGYYVIDVPNVGVHLTFTCLGYKPQTAVVPKSLSLDIYMEEDTLEMDAAVVVGMGHQPGLAISARTEKVPVSGSTCGSAKSTSPRSGYWVLSASVMVM